MDATGAGAALATETLAGALFPSTVAVTVTVPFDTPVTRPEFETVATMGFELLHVGTRDARTLPLASMAVAASCTSSPTRTLGADGETVTEAAATVVDWNCDVPLTPAAVAEMVAVPTLTAVTSPLAETEA